MITRSKFVAVVAAAALAALSTDAAAASAPRVGIDSINALSIPGRPYDETADADRAVDAAIARAAHSHKLVLIDRGHVSALADARSMSPQGLADWLASWTR